MQELLMKEDLKLIRQRLKAIKQMPETNPKEYNLKMDLFYHWKLEQHKLKLSIEYDLLHLEKMRR
jgi:hypothetical protein